MIEILPESITKDNSALEFGALGNDPSVRPRQGNEENGGLVAWEVMGCRSKQDGREGVGSLGGGKSVYMAEVEPFQGCTGV